jgi:hypothetical protein
VKIRKGQDTLAKDGERYGRCVWCGKVAPISDGLSVSGEHMRWRNGHRVPYTVWSCSGECLDALKASQSELTDFDAVRIANHFGNAIHSCRHPAVAAIGGVATQAAINALTMLMEAIHNTAKENRRRREVSG